MTLLVGVEGPQARIQGVGGGGVHPLPFGPLKIIQTQTWGRPWHSRKVVLSYWGLTFMGSMIAFMMKNKAELGMPSQMNRRLYSMEQQLYNSTLAPGPTV